MIPLPRSSSSSSSPTMGLQLILALIGFIVSMGYFAVGDKKTASMWLVISLIVLGAPMLFAMV